MTVHAERPTAQSRGIPAPRTWSRAEMLLAGVLLALAVTAWVTTSQVAMPGMRTGVLTGMRSMESGMEPGMESGMEPGAGSAAAFGLFLGTWVVMMAAMMLPAITPFMVGMSRLLRGRTGQGTMGALVVGYLLVWATAGLLGYAVVLGFESVSAEGGPVAVRAGGGVLLLAGAYQFTPLKQWCLARCRSPLALVVRYADAAAHDRVRAVTVGARHGGYCLGCCWALMGVLLAAGVMSLAWMATIAAVITVEKVLPRAGQISFVPGALLLVLGAVLLAAPDLAPAMA